ncbi:type II and III secretion system protein family protein [Oxalobacteraceae bacterium]|nr:type II and III secretion system protein family protein [Oxalobacteraceae bacterium]
MVPLAHAAPASSPPLAALAPAAPPASRAIPVLAPSDMGLRCTGEAATPGKLTLALGKSTLMRLPESIQNRSVGNPAVLQAMLVGPDTLYVVGSDIGSTNMIVQGRSGVCSVIEVTVGADPGALQATLAALMPEERNIRVSAAADALVLSGSVADAVALSRALELAAAHARRPVRALKGGQGQQGQQGQHNEAANAPAQGAAATTVMMQGGTAAGEAGAGTGNQGGAATRVVNMLSIGSPQQVMLEVKIAEVSKSLLDKLEMNGALRLAGGSWAATLASNFLTGTARGGLSLSKGHNFFQLEAEKQDGLVRMLAEPTVMAISGQEGSFLAGGKIFIPVAQDNNKITLEEREFGVGLRFTPTVLAGSRINLRVAPEVSELSREGIGISVAGTSGSVLPLFTTRRASTTVELSDGQSFAIGGLIKNNQVSNIRGMPVLGELPVLGALFRSTDFQQDRTELLFVITAHLVKPLAPGYALPTDQLTPASRAGLFLGGQLEGKAPPSAPAPATRQQAGAGFELK